MFSLRQAISLNITIKLLVTKLR